MSVHPKARRESPRVPRALTLGLVLLAGACAAANRGPPQPVTSPTGYTYPLGTPPTETLFSQTASLYIRQGSLERAYELAEEGIQDDPENPIHYFEAARALSRLGRLEEADRRFDRAQEIYPAYELDIEPERVGAWAEAFNEGVEAYGEGDFDAAIEAWRSATTIYEMRPGAHQNLATLLAGRGDYEEAIALYDEALEGLGRRPATRVLSEEELQERDETRWAIESSLTQLLMFEERFADAEPLLRSQLGRDPEDPQLRNDLATALVGLGRDDEAGEIYGDLLTADGLESAQLFNLGVALFRAGTYVEAGEAFRRLTDLEPLSRDAWFNYANSLFAAEAWDTLARVASRVRELDPLSESAALIGARAHYETGDEEAARAAVAAADSAGVYVEGLQLRPGQTETVLQGTVVGNVAPPGTPIRLRFAFAAEGGPERMLTVPAPAPDERAPFEITIDGRHTSYRYEVLP